MDVSENLENPQVLFMWKAPLRPYKKRSAIIIRFYLAVSLLLSLIVLFFGDKILIIPIISLLFLFYMLTVTPPPEVENKVTRFGIEAAGITLRWDVLSYFYFKKRFQYTLLVVVTKEPYFYHAYMVVPSAEIKELLIHTLSEHLVYKEKPEKTFVDRAVDWASALIPDEDADQATAPKPQASSL